MAQTLPSTHADAARLPARPGRWEWGLCWLMFASTVLCYLDRQAMTLVGPEIKAEFGLANEDFGWVLAAFSLTYALFQVPAGFLADLWDVRRTYAGAVVWWSLAGMAAAVSPTLGLLMASRALLGVGESFNWPCALRVTGRILPPADRGLGNGIFNSGAAVGAVLAPLTVPPMARWFGWRTAFLIVGALGFAWVAAWLVAPGRDGAARLSGTSGSGPRRGEGEVGPGVGAIARASFAAVGVVAALVALSTLWGGLPRIWWGIAVLMLGLLIAARLLPPDQLGGAGWARDLGAVTRLRRFWTLVVVSISVNVSWHFLVNWMAIFFQEERGLGALAGGMASAIPFLAADAGNLGGGWLSRLLARRGLAPSRARIRVVALSTLLIATGVGIGSLTSDALILVLLAVMAFGTAAFMANYFAYCQEVSARHTGLVVGLLGALGNLFAAGFLPIAGRIKDLSGGFGPSFAIVGLLPMAGLVALLAGWSPEEGEARSA